MKKNKFKVIKLGVATLLTVATLATTAFAYNYKFSFDFNTGLFHSAGYSDYATKYTDDEHPVLKVTHVESGANTEFSVVNSKNEIRTNTITTNQAWSGRFNNNITEKGYMYKLRGQTDSGNFWNTYNVKGAWNIDEW